MKKRNLLSVLLGLCLLAAVIFCFPTEAQAEATLIGRGICGDNLTWTLDDTGLLTISGTGEIKAVSQWDYNSNIKTVVIEEGATSIPKEAFYDCNNLTNITIPTSVTSIGEGAFYSCDSLVSVTIPEGVPSIGKETFYYCSSLTSITIPASVTSIGANAFEGCSSLKNDGVYITDLGAWCRISFENAYANPVRLAKNLYINGVLATDIVIPEGITVIKENTFHNCDCLVSVTFPKDLTTIEGYAFHDANNLTSITFPGSINTIGFAFGGCTKLEKVDIYDVAAWCQVTYTDTMGSPFACSSAAKLYVNGELATKVVIPNGVTQINKHAFYSLEELEEVTIPKGMLQIASDAFYKCNNIKTVYHKGSEADWETIYGYWVFGDAEVIHDYVSPTHYWDAGVETTAPTCKEAGIKTFTCTVCGDSYTEEIAKLATHSYDAGVETKAPTCKEAGIKTFTCTVCGDSYTEEIAKLATHSYDAGVETTAPTCKEAGVKTFTCTVCGDSYTEEIAKSTQHTFADGICTVCGESDPDYVAPSEPTDPTDPEGEETLGFFEAIVKFFQDLFKILFFFLYL